MDKGTVLGLLVTSAFFVAWFWFANFGMKKKGWSFVISLGGGFIVGILAVLALAAPIAIVQIIMESSADETAPSRSQDTTRASTTQDPTDTIWSAFANHPGNADQGVRYMNVSGRIVRRGTVPASAVNSSAREPLPAYLACYDYVMVMSGLGDVEADMCVFYIDNPTRGTHSLMWKGKQYLGQLEQSMADYGFKST